MQKSIRAFNCFLEQQMTSLQNNSNVNHTSRFDDTCSSYLDMQDIVSLFEFDADFDFFGSEAPSSGENTCHVDEVTVFSEPLKPKNEETSGENGSLGCKRATEEEPNEMRSPEGGSLRSVKRRSVSLTGSEDGDLSASAHCSTTCHPHTTRHGHSNPYFSPYSYQSYQYPWSSVHRTTRRYPSHFQHREFWKHRGNRPNTAPSSGHITRE